MTDVQATLVITREYADLLKASKSAASHKCHDDLQLAVHRLSEHLNGLADLIWAVPLRKGKGPRSLAFSDGKKEKLSELSDLLSEAHRNLQTVLSSANL